MKLTFLIGVLLLILGLGAEYTYSAEVDILADRRGLVKKRELYIKISLTDASGKLNPANDAIYGSDKLHFMITTVGDWEFDSDYIERMISYLIFSQDGKENRVLRHTPILEGEKITRVFVQIHRNLDLTRPFTIHLNLKNIESRAEFYVPEELWPDYTTLKNDYDVAKIAFESNNLTIAFSKLTKILENPNLARLPFYQDACELRKTIFNKTFQSILSDNTRIRMDTAITVEVKLCSLKLLMNRFNVLIDTMRFDSLAAAPDVQALREMRGTAVSNREQLRLFIENTSSNYDNSLVEWMGTAGPNDYRLWLLVQAIYAMFRGQSMEGGWNSLVAIPDSISSKLAMVNLNKNLEAIKRVIECNQAAGKFLLPDGIFRHFRRYVGVFNDENVNINQPFIEVIIMGIYFYQGKLDSAGFYLDRAMAGSSDIEMNNWLGQIQARVKPVNVRDAGPVKDLSKEGRKLLESGDLEGALAKFQHVELMAPNSALNLYNLGLYNLLKKDTLRAITYFEKALAADSSLSIVYRRLGNLYTSQSQWDNAIRLLEKAKRTSNTWEFNYFLAFSLYQRGNYSRAITCLRDAIALNNKNYHLYILLGDVYLKSNLKEEARTQYDHARQLEPERQEAYEKIKALND